MPKKHVGRLALATNQGEISIPLQGIGVLPPKLSISTTEVDFGRVPAGMSNAQTLTITNVGESWLAGSVHSRKPLNPLISIHPQNYILRKGESVDIKISFSPVVADNVLEHLIFTGGGGAQITVRGRGDDVLERDLSTPSANSSAKGEAPGSS